MSKKKILIIDDETDLLETMSFRLDAAGFEVLIARDGSSGVKTAKEKKPDLIILDIMMPGIDGFQTLEALKKDEETKKTPVLMHSCGSEEEGWAKRALEIGAVGYVVKPFDTQALLFTVNKFLE